MAHLRLRVARSSHGPAAHRRRCRGLPPQVTASPSRGSVPGPTSRAGAACLPRLWASRAGLSAPAALSKPLLTLRREFRETVNSKGHAATSQPVLPRGGRGLLGTVFVARAPPGSPGLPPGAGGNWRAERDWQKSLLQGVPGRVCRLVPTFTIWEQFRL